VELFIRNISEFFLIFHEENFYITTLHLFFTQNIALHNIRNNATVIIVPPKVQTKAQRYPVIQQLSWYIIRPM